MNFTIKQSLLKSKVFIFVELVKAMNKCPKCGSDELWNAGAVHIKGEDRVRKKCKKCGYQFTKETPKAYPNEKKLQAIELLKEGMSYRGVSRTLNTSMETIRRWVTLGKVN